MRFVFHFQTLWVGCHFLLQGIFPNQGLKLGLLHCRKSSQGSPKLPFNRKTCNYFYLFIYLFFKFYFIFKLYITVLVLPNIKMNPPQVYMMCSPSWTLLPLPSSLPIPSLWVVPVHQPQASSIMHRTWTGNSFHTWYFTCFSSPFCCKHLPSSSRDMETEYASQMGMTLPPPRGYLTTSGDSFGVAPGRQGATSI